MGGHDINLPSPQQTLTQLRVALIESVKTPIGFFALIALIAEAILGTAAIFIDRPEKTYLVVSMIILVFLLVILVALFATFRPEALSGLRPPRALPSSDEARPDPALRIDDIAKKADVDPAQVDPKLVRFIPPLHPTQFKIVSLPATEPQTHFEWPYSPTGKIPVYGIPFFLLPVTGPAGIPLGHLTVDVQPSEDNAPSTRTIDAQVAGVRHIHLLISAGHGWRMHKGLQFLHRRIGYLRIFFADTTEQRFDLYLGRHLREWAFGNNTNLVTELDLNQARPAWLSHNSTKRFDLLTVGVSGGPKDLHAIEVTGQFEDDHVGKKIATPAIRVSAITVERAI